MSVDNVKIGLLIVQKLFHGNRGKVKATLHSVEKTLIQKAYCVYYYILKERRFFYVD